MKSKRTKILAVDRTVFKTNTYLVSGESRRKLHRTIQLDYINRTTELRKSPKLNFNSIRIESKRFIDDVRVLKAYIRKDKPVKSE